MTKKSCEDCKWALMEDSGYSNYTVENTAFYCLRGLHPDGSFDRYYGEEKKLGFAEQCGSFVKGEHVWIDVDREGLKKFDDPLSSAYTTDPEVAALLDKWEQR